MMAKQSEFFASRTVKIRTVDGAHYHFVARGAPRVETIKVIVSN
jgi:hypothetical protein